MPDTHSDARGFTLIELLIILAIMGIIAFVSTPSALRGDEILAVPEGSFMNAPRPATMVFNVPGRLKLGDSPEVSIRLDLKGTSFFQSIGARMTSVGLVVKPEDTQSGGGDVVDFRWIIGATKTGSSDVRVEFFGARFPSSQISALRRRGLPVLDAGDNYILFRIEVTNALGLTNTQVAIFQGVGSVFGLLGGSALLKKGLESWSKKRTSKVEDAHFE